MQQIFEPEKEKAWWNEGVAFSCKGCGQCCRGEPGAIFFTVEEGKRVKNFLKITESEFTRNYVTLRWGKPSFVERQNGDCVFYDSASAKCLIYSIRPVQCSLFPFWASMMESEKIWNKQAQHCPGMNNGQIHTAEEIIHALKQDPFGDL